MRLSFPSPPNLFPTYLTPSLPFRRRQTSSDSQSSTLSVDSDSPTPTETFLGGHSSHLQCSRCLADLAHSHQIISKGFTGRHGRAYLVAPPDSLTIPAQTPPSSRYGAQPNLPNTYTHKPVSRHLVTGSHTVCDISCAQCGSVLGWKYVAAEEEAQRYKVGKFILETKRVCRANCWDNETGTANVPGGTTPKKNDIDNDVEFDSQDEDECEDLFLGVWTAQTAVKRRKTKAFARREE